MPAALFADGDIPGWMGFLVGAATLFGGAIGWIANRRDKKDAEAIQRLEGWVARLEEHRTTCDEKVQALEARADAQDAKLMDLNVRDIRKGMHVVMLQDLLDRAKDESGKPITYRKWAEDPGK